MPPRRALLLHLTLPTWTTEKAVGRLWSEVIGPTLDSVHDAGNPVGLVLAGRMLEVVPPAEQVRIDRLCKAVRRGRVELVGTALHEPLLGSVPERDAVGQYIAHATLLRRLLGARPTGGWLPRGAWDSSTPMVFQKAGLTWTTIDRLRLERLGCAAAPLLGVERHGKSITVVPSTPLTPKAWSGLAVMRVNTPQDVRVMRAALPRTTALPSSLILRTRARAYLPSDTVWERALLVDAGADRLRKRMLAVSRLAKKVQRAIERTRHTQDGPDPRLLEQIRRYLYRAQSADALVPSPAAVGRSRDRAWRDLIRAETLALDALPLAVPWICRVDEDCDGKEEVRVVTNAWTATVSPAHEGALTELCHRSSAGNLLSTAYPVGFRERWNEGAPVAMEWDLVTTELPGEGIVRVTTLAESLLGDAPVQVLKRLSLEGTGPAELCLEVRSKAGGARGRVSTELFVGLGGTHADGDKDCALIVEVAGHKVPVDEEIELPALDAIGLCGWRLRVDFELSPAGAVCVEPLEQGGARVQFSWPVEVFSGDVDRRTVRLSVREVVHG